LLRLHNLIPWINQLNFSTKQLRLAWLAWLLLLLLIHSVVARGLLALSDHRSRLRRITFEYVETTIGADQVDAAALGLVRDILVLMNQLR
jgi:hypothetical protein